MCRHAAFPPNFPRDKALKIIDNFANGQRDGTGSVYLNNGKFVVNKYPLPFEVIMKQQVPFIDHMPYPGWTLVHLRSATHGNALKKNTHPFIRNDFAVTHNGVWGDHDIVRAALEPYVKDWEGETDSETAAHLFAPFGFR